MLVLASCSGANDLGEDAAPLRLGTHNGVAVMGPTVTTSFTRNIVDLVYKTPLSAYFSSVTIEGTRVRLRARNDVPTNLAQLAGTLTYPDLVSAVADGSEVVVELRTAEAASSIALDSLMIADGPYRTLESIEGHLVLARRSPGEGPGRIEVTAVPSAEEEWRRFLNGEYDAMPVVLPGAAAYLEQVPTVRIVRLSNSASAALWFRMDGGPMQDLGLRRAISGLVRRKALAVSVTGREGDASAGETEDDAGRATLLAAGIVPERSLLLHLIVHDAQSDMVRAALVLQQQLDAYGIELRIESLPEAQFRERWYKHDFDLLLFTGDRTPRYFGMIGSSGQSAIGYASADFDAAVKANDLTRAKQILDHDLPLTPLFDQGESVAIKREFCNVHPRNTADLTWLADIRRCRPGEDE